MNRILFKAIVIFWKFLMELPFFIQKILSNLIGVSFFLIPNNRKKFALKNIELCFKDHSNDEIKKIFNKNIVSSGKIFFYTGMAWFWSKERLNKNLQYKINGLDKLIEEQNQKNGVILFFKHSHHLELDSRILGMHCELYGVQRDHNSRFFQNIQTTGRLNGLKGICDRNNVINFMRWLKKGKTVLYATDQDYGAKKSNVLSFFNQQCSTISAPAKIIKSSKCKIYFLNSYFEEENLVLDVEELRISSFDAQKFSQELNNLIEDKIRKHPHEYLWQHRRFKSTLGKEFYR